MQREGESKCEHAYKNSVDVENTDGEETFSKRGKDGGMFQIINADRNRFCRQNEHATWISARNERLDLKKALGKSERILNCYSKGINWPVKLME